MSVSAAPLAVFRISFGLMMLISMIRFWANGWIEKLYLEPDFHFSYWGFEWVQPLGDWTYLIFILCGLASIGVMLGWRYHWSMLVFFLSFTYIELMDKTTYLNHYYFVSVLSLLLLFLPMSRYFSLDARHADYERTQVPRWTIWVIQGLMGIVYFYAGLAKLNTDWLVHAMPLKIWLPAKYDLPLIGGLLQQEWTHYAFSWAGAAYDLSIPFLLLWSRTRPLAFLAVIFFHLMTAWLFPIGMFPYIMIVSALIFFPASVHERIIGFLRRLFRIDSKSDRLSRTLVYSRAEKRAFKVGLTCFFAFQLLFPFRYLAYPGKLFWTEEGYRFSWRVMLMEKAGYANFKIVDPATGQRQYVDNNRYLTAFQQKQMSTQPDFILEYAHFLADAYRQKGIENPEVYVESYVALNGRMSQPYIDPNVNLATVRPSWRHKTWILEFED